MFFHKLLAKRLNHNVATVYFVSVPQMSVGKMVFDQKTWSRLDGLATLQVDQVYLIAAPALKAKPCLNKHITKTLVELGPSPTCCRSLYILVYN